MIEELIYWTGVTTLFSVGLVVTLFSWYLITCAILKMLVRELRSTYNHTQLYYFMRQLKSKGYAQAVDEIGED